MSTILIIDDNEAICSALGILLSLYELESVYAHTPAAGLEVLDTRNIDLIIQDMNFTEDTTSGEEGEQLFATIRQRYPALPIVLLTAWTHLETAVNLVKSGAADYLAKPWDDISSRTFQPATTSVSKPSPTGTGKSVRSGVPSGRSKSSDGNGTSK